MQSVRFSFAQFASAALLVCLIAGALAANTPIVGALAAGAPIAGAPAASSAQQAQAQAQPGAPPPAAAQAAPAPAAAPGSDAGTPNLPATMQFIQDKLNNHGADVERFYYGDGGGVSPGDDRQNLKATADPASCMIRLNVLHADPTKQLFTLVASLKDFRRVTAGANANPGMLEIRAASATLMLRSEFDFDIRGDRLPQPKMFDDSVAAFTLRFFDPHMADRVGKAIQHAMDLCGGGSGRKPGEPF